MAICWTLQQTFLWEQMQRDGYLSGNPDHAMFPEEYQWMMQQMKKRIPSYQGHYPIWIWPQKPDLRIQSHFIKDISFVRLTLEIPDEDLLISHFDEWHSILNKWYVAENEEEWRLWDEGQPTPVTLQESWERIFDINRPRDAYWHGEYQDLQAVTQRIYLPQVKKVEHFVSRQRLHEYGEEE